MTRLPTPLRRAAQIAPQALLARCAAACAVLVLSACSLLPKPDAQETYALPTFTPAPAAQTPTGWALRVNTPVALSSLDSHLVLVQYPNASLAAWRGIRWSDRAPVLLREHLAQYFSDSGLFRVVIAGTSVAPTDVELAMTLRTFQLFAPDAQARVEVRLQARLIDSQNPRVLDQKLFTHVQAVSNPRQPDAVIAAFGRASDALAAAMTDWIAGLARTQHATGNAP